MQYPRQEWNLLRILHIMMLLCGFSGVAGFPPMLANASIHQAPIVVTGFRIRAASRYPISTYRLFRTGADGSAVPIPYQIDELNDWGDYVLDQGGPITKDTGNGIFDLQDELVFMGNDVGPVSPPTKWPQGQPTLTYEIRLSHLGKNPVGPNDGAVYLGIYFREAPALNTTSYVVFDAKQGTVSTSRYTYKFDRKNYLVVDGVDMVTKEAGGKRGSVPIIDTSTFFMKADLKYFVTMEANHRTVNSQIEAYKVGPVRSIVRVSFFYSFLKLKFELGMYTEVSFFSNAVVLPAILYNPLDGPKSLNAGSGFYYGFALNDKPSAYNLQSNMPAYRKGSFLDMFRKQDKLEPLYWISLTGADRMMYVELLPSPAMLEARSVPFLYTEDLAGKELKSRSNNTPAELGKAPVNLGLFFDLTRFKEGEHRMSFRLFFENTYDPAQLESFRTMNNWQIILNRS